MKTYLYLAAASLAVATPVYAQDQNLNSASGSEANANSGSISGASSNGNQQGQSQTANNAGIGSSTSESNSGAAAVSGSESHSGSYSDQGQSQGQSQTQGQQVGAHTATNQQGVSTSITFNSTNRKHSYVGTNTPVYLAASSSFSSDYCGGTVSGGASVAPIGVSVGGSGTKFDDSCRYLRLAEKSGMTAANYHNMGQPEMAMKMMSLMVWADCMAGPQQDKRRDSSPNYTMQACIALGILGSEGSPPSPPAVYSAPPPPAMESQKDNLDPNQYENLPPKEPRGANDNLPSMPGNTAAHPTPLAASGVR